MPGLDVQLPISKVAVWIIDSICKNLEREGIETISVEELRQFSARLQKNDEDGCDVQ